MAAAGSAGRLQAVNPFKSFFMGGFECSSHRHDGGPRLDVVAATKHDEMAASDYRQLRNHGIQTVRDGLRWHLIDKGPLGYDWSSFLPMLRAANETGTQVIWDLCHYGWPDDLDIWSPAFVERFGRFAEATARLIRDESDAVPFFCPVNEISFWAWGGGDVGYLNPHLHGHGDRLKRLLVQASIAAIRAVRSVDPRARIVHAEPVIHIEPRGGHTQDIEPVAHHMTSQWHALDMLAGRRLPELGGRPEYLDIVGVNYYPNNQWVNDGGPIPLGRHDYRPFRDILLTAFRRYGRPMIVAETGAEGSAGPSWLHYIAGEVDAVIAAGVPVEGICLYPVLDYPGWDDDRTCPVGLLQLAPGRHGRLVQEALATELRRQIEIRIGETRKRSRRPLVGDKRRPRRSTTPQSAQA